MPDQFRKLRPGERLTGLPADTWNTFVDVAQDYQRSRFTGVRPTDSITVPDLVRVKNSTDGDLDRFAVLTLDGPIISASDNLLEFQNRINFSGISPVAGRPFAILQEPAPAGLIAKAVLNSCTPVKVEVTDEAHGYADVTPGDTTKLTSADYGPAEILTKQSGTGEKWAYVRVATGSTTGGIRMFRLLGPLCPCDPYGASAITVTLSGGYEVLGPVFTVIDRAGITEKLDPPDCGSSGSAGSTGSDGSGSGSGSGSGCAVAGQMGFAVKMGSEWVLLNIGRGCCPPEIPRFSTPCLKEICGESFTGLANTLHVDLVSSDIGAVQELPIDLYNTYPDGSVGGQWYQDYGLPDRLIPFIRIPNEAGLDQALSRFNFACHGSDPAQLQLQFVKWYMFGDTIPVGQTGTFVVQEPPDSTDCSAREFLFTVNLTDPTCTLTFKVRE